MSEKCPTEPLILIIDGLDAGSPVRNALAARGEREGGGVYRIVSGNRSGSRLYPGLADDAISDWIEATAVPKSLLDRLRYLLDNEAREVLLADVVHKLLKSDLTRLNSAIGTVAGVLERDDRGLKRSLESYTGCLLRSMPGDTPHPGYLDLLTMAEESMTYLRHEDVPEPLDTIKSGAQQMELPGDADGRFNLLTRGIGEFLVSPGINNAAHIGSIAVAWAAALSANI